MNSASGKNLLYLRGMGRILRDNSAELSASAAPTSVAGSSPLSELPEDPQVDDEATIYAGSAADDNDEAVTDDDEANEQSSNEAFRCEYCGKAYQNQKSLKVCTVGYLRLD
jgi:hypothetical protein